MGAFVFGAGSGTALTHFPPVVRIERHDSVPRAHPERDSYSVRTFLGAQCASLNRHLLDTLAFAPVSLRSEAESQFARQIGGREQRTHASSTSRLGTSRICVSSASAAAQKRLSHELTSYTKPDNSAFLLCARYFER